MILLWNKIDLRFLKLHFVICVPVLKLLDIMVSFNYWDIAVSLFKCLYLVDIIIYRHINIKCTLTLCIHGVTFWRRTITAWKMSSFGVFLVRMQWIKGQKNSAYGHFLRSEYSFVPGIFINLGKDLSLSFHKIFLIKVDLSSR